MEGPRVSIVPATKVILVFSLVASLGKYSFESVSINFIDCSIENSYTGEVEKSDIRFHSSSHLSKQVSNL